MKTQLQNQNPTGAAPGAANDLTLREATKAPSRESGTREGRYFEPQVDIFETEAALVIQADLPGVEAADVETQLENSLLTITAPLKSQQQPEDGWRKVYAEYAEGHFQRQFRLGQRIDQTKISAAMKDGVLTLTLPKVDSARPRRIQVQAG